MNTDSYIYFAVPQMGDVVGIITKEVNVHRRGCKTHPFHEWQSKDGNDRVISTYGKTPLEVDRIRWRRRSKYLERFPQCSSSGPAKTFGKFGWHKFAPCSHEQGIAENLAEPTKRPGHRRR